MKRAMIRTAAAAAGISMILGSTMSTYAASMVNIENQSYETAAEGVGSQGGTWNWDGGDKLALNNFQSESPIEAAGSLQINLEGENRSGEILVSSDSENTSETAAAITGGGTLQVSADGMAGIGVQGGLEISGGSRVTVEGELGYGIAAENVNIHDAEVSVKTSSGMNLEYEGGISGRDVSVKNAKVDIDVEDDAYGSYGIFGEKNVSIEDSEVRINVKTNSEYGFERYGICANGAPAIAGETAEAGRVSIRNSTVDVKAAPNGAAVIAMGQGDAAGEIILENAHIQNAGMGVRELDFPLEGGSARIIAQQGEAIRPVIDNGEEEPLAALQKAMQNAYAEAGAGSVKIVPGSAGMQTAVKAAGSAEKYDLAAVFKATLDELQETGSGYGLYDMDGDGIKELFILDKSGADGENGYLVYKYDGKQVLYCGRILASGDSCIRGYGKSVVVQNTSEDGVQVEQHTLSGTTIRTERIFEGQQTLVIPDSVTEWHNGTEITFTNSMTNRSLLKQR